MCHSVVDGNILNIVVLCFWVKVLFVLIGLRGDFNTLIKQPYETRQFRVMSVIEGLDVALGGSFISKTNQIAALLVIKKHTHKCSYYLSQCIFSSNISQHDI